MAKSEDAARDPEYTQPDPIQRCPICEGCGTVPCDFYARIGLVTNTSRELCRTCEGGGILWTASGRPARPQEWGKTADGQ